MSTYSIPISVCVCGGGKCNEGDIKKKPES